MDCYHLFPAIQKVVILPQGYLYATELMSLPTPFIPGHIYNRRLDIHDIYGGNRQSGICPSTTTPFIFIFTGKTGQQHGYKDEWENPNIFSYTGEGQSGNMDFIRGNLALRNHLANGKRVFLFESEGTGWAKFMAEVEYSDADYFEAPDTSGKMRTAIKFFFKRIGVYVPKIPSIIDIKGNVSEQVIPYGLHLPNKTERSGLVTSRVGQDAYRKGIIYRWEYKCAVTGFDKLDVLIASHIHPWAKATDNERLDVNNGILLSPTYDALFDRHLISFEENGKIILSNKVEAQAFAKIGVTGKEKITDLRSDNNFYLEKHRLEFGSRL